MSSFTDCCIGAQYDLPSPSYDGVSMGGVFGLPSLQSGPLALGAPHHLDKFHMSTQHQHQQQHLRRGLMGGPVGGAMHGRALVGPPHSGECTVTETE